MFALSNPSLATQKVAVGGRQVRARRAAPTRRAVAVSPKARLYDNILETIGDTPIVKINRLAPEGVTMYAKAEFFNPCSSVKDRYVPVRDGTRVRFSVSRPIDAGSDPHRPRGRPDRNHTRDDSRSSPFALFRRTLYSANLRPNRKRDVFTSAEGSTSVGAPRRERDSNTRRNRTLPRRFSTTRTRKTPS